MAQAVESESMSRERHESDVRTPAALVPAHAALDAGRIDEAYALAQAVADASRGVDPHLEAHALTCQAHCDRVVSHLRRASEASRRAAQLFEQLGDHYGEAGALITLTHVSMLLGRNDEAVEAALLSVRLSDARTPHPQMVLAHNCLGLAFSWSGDHDRAYASLEKAVNVARRCEPEVSIYQPRLNQVWVEASRLVDERYQTGAMKSVKRLQRLVHECWQLERSGAAWAVLPGLKPLARTLSLASSALLAAWQHDLVAAKLAVESASRSLSDTPTWLDAFVRWTAAELSWAQGHWVDTERQLGEMKSLALDVEHEQLACRAHLLLVQVLELQGKHQAAQREQRALRRRERRVISDGLSSRESLVSWQLGARQSERHLQQALVAQKQFERWSLEDALTGIANRRNFEGTLAERLKTAVLMGRPLTVAMVDVDQFKAVNDRFSHRIGDRVLKTIAAIMASQVRDSDLPARWAGDEFVILFEDTREREALQVCERIQSAVAAFDWESIAPALRMTVSIGVSEARAGDTPEAVVHRSDESMYRAKPAKAIAG